MTPTTKKTLAVLPILVAALVVSSTAGAQDPEAGLAILEQNCLKCHGVGPEGRSPHSEAPTFTEITGLYEPHLLAESLAEGIVTGHPDMPEFVFAPEQIDDIIAYLQTLD
jgi:cytochrome c